MLIKPKKSLGQNFLIDKNIIKKIVELENINSDDFILEVGPGTGNLTEFILKKNPKKFFVIEKDKNLIEVLKKKFEDRINIIENDIDQNLKYKKRISIKNVKGLLTDFAKNNQATCIIRGLRAVSDFEYEFQMTGMNYKLNPKIETIFLMSSDNNSFISSNFVKEVHKLGGNVSKFVSKNAIKILNKKNF